MKVRCTRLNSDGVLVSKQAEEFYSYTYDRASKQGKKKYKPAEIGFESDVYAIRIYNGYSSYYVRHPKYGDITHLPSVCFDIIDPRISSIWEIRDQYLENKSRLNNLPSIIPITWFAIREWIEEPRFLEFYSEGKKREVEIMEAAAKFIETEFSEN